MSAALYDALRHVTTATITTMLLKKGIRRCWMNGPKPLVPAGERIVGPEMWNEYERWPVYSKFFDNMGPIPHHMHQTKEQAALVGQECKPESYYFPPQHNNTGNNFPYTFMGLEPGTTKDQVRRCLENWDKGENGILDLSRAYRLRRGTGWLIPPGVLHAPGSLCTYEPQWGSDVFAMFQSMVECRCVPWRPASPSAAACNMGTGSSASPTASRCGRRRAPFRERRRSPPASPPRRPGRCRG